MSDYNAAECLREEVLRFKSTNTFTPMEVTGFYIQAAVVLDEHAALTVRCAELEKERDAFSRLNNEFGETLEKVLPRLKEAEWLITNMPMNYFQDTPPEHKRRRDAWLKVVKP